MSFGGAQMWEEGGGALGIGGHSRPGLPVPIDPRREGGRGAPASLLPRLVLPPYQTPMQAPSSLSMLPNSKKVLSFALVEIFLQKLPKEWPQKHCNGITAQCRFPAPLRASHTPHSALAGCNSTLQIIKGPSSLTDAT